MRYHTWKEWHGDEEVENSGFIDVPYHRYPRLYIPAPSVELTIVRKGPQKYVLGKCLNVTEANYDDLLHQLKLFLEIFNKCDLGEENVDSFKDIPIKKLNWRILPQGYRSFDDLTNDINQVIQKLSVKHQKIAMYRIEKINQYTPTCYAIGQAGFLGYIVFGFPNKHLFVLESVYEKNATYILGDDWKKISKLSKYEIVSNNFQEHRLVHQKNWNTRIKQILN